VRVFETPQVSADVVMASACLPFLFKAVEIDGEHYWDGGYVGNPALFPFFYNCESRDVMIVHINPMERDEVPKTAPDILNRINEISFNSSLLDEMRAINFVTRLIEQDWLKDEYKNRLRHILVHSVRADAACWIFRCPRNSTCAGRSSPICAIADASRRTDGSKPTGTRLARSRPSTSKASIWGYPAPRRKDGSQTRDTPALAESGSD
jgi:NTE family protein